jgi:hypothetical protein
LERTGELDISSFEDNWTQMLKKTKAAIDEYSNDLMADVNEKKLHPSAINPLAFSKYCVIIYNVGSKSKKQTKKGKPKIKIGELISVIANIAGIISCLVGLYQCFRG